MDSYLEGSFTKKQANYGIWKGFEEEFEEEFEKARRCTCTIAYSECLTGHCCDVARVKREKPKKHRVVIAMLPDVTLLEIFDFYIHDQERRRWYRLVHVCRKWRNTVLFLGHPVAWTCDFTAQPEPQ
jgi:hypothetical protein